MLGKTSSGGRGRRCAEKRTSEGDVREKRERGGGNYRATARWGWVGTAKPCTETRGNAEGEGKWCTRQDLNLQPSDP